MPGALARDEPAAGPLATSAVILKSDLQGSFHGFRSARTEEDRGEGRSTAIEKDGRQFLERIAGPGGTIAVHDFAQLPGNRLVYFFIAVPRQKTAGPPEPSMYCLPVVS